MRFVHRLLFVWAVAFALLLTSHSTGFAQKSGSEGARPKLPDISLNTIGGEKWKLSDEIGKTVILNFWATWCEPCRIEIPYLIKLSSEFKESGLRVVGINLDKETDDRVTKFVGEFKIDYPILTPPVGSPFWDLEELPTTLLIDTEGRLVRRYTGAVPEKELRKDLELILPTKTSGAGK